MIDLSKCTTVKSADLKAHKKHSFEISTPETTYLLYAGEVCSDIILCAVTYFSRSNNYILIRNRSNTNDIPNAIECKCCGSQKMTKKQKMIG